MLTGCGGSSAPASSKIDASLPKVSVTGGYTSLPPNTGGGVQSKEVNANVRFTISLGSQPNGIASVDYTAVSGSATRRIDFSVTDGTLSFQPGELQKTVDVRVTGGGSRHPYTTPTDKTFYLQLQNPSANIVLGTARAPGTIMYAPGLNDTGITSCATIAAKGLPCENAASGTDAYPLQDAEFGRDVIAENNQLSKIGAGVAAFDFTKLNINGSPLPDQTVGYAANPWYCLRDNVTGLFWEVKTADSNPSFSRHHASNTYTWYKDGNNPLGTAGTAGTCADSPCDTDAYVTAVNQQGYCGSTSWRMPTADELQSLADYGRINSPAIDTDYFPFTQAGDYWAASQAAGTSGLAWSVDFSSGAIGRRDTADAAHIRLVHTK